ncbi:hypothetical protein Tco_0235707 [Tanacetum coccineum]
MGLEAGPTFTPVAQETSAGTKSGKSTSVLYVDGSPGSIFQPGWGVTNNYRLDTPEECQDMVDHTMPPGYFSKLSHLPNTEFMGQYNMNLVRQVAIGLEMEVHGLHNQTQNLETLLKAEVDMKKLFQQVSNLQAQVTEIDARLDALSIDFDDELYPHMLTAIAHRRWVIGHGLRLAVMKYVESTELREVFADVVSAGIVKGMSEGLKHGVEQGEEIDQLEKLKDAPIDLIMASLHLESDSREDAPQWIRELCPSSSQLKIIVYPKVRDPKDPWPIKEEIRLEDAIAANIIRAKKKKKCRVVCRTHSVGSAHHAKSEGIPVSMPTVASQGLAIVLADAAIQTEICEDEASPRLLRSKSLPPMYNLDWP